MAPAAEDIRRKLDSCSTFLASSQLVCQHSVVKGKEQRGVTHASNLKCLCRAVE